MTAYHKSVIRWLIFCFPAGLLMMWSDRCRWSRGVKSAVSVALACLVIAVVLPQTLPPERVDGGVKIVSLNSAARDEVQGPRQTVEDEDDYEPYVPTYIVPSSLVVAPTPAPEPVYVYCNVGGKNYHVKKCRYVKKSSARVVLSQAIDVGYSRCVECDAPKEYA